MICLNCSIEIWSSIHIKSICSLFVVLCLFALIKLDLNYASLLLKSITKLFHKIRSKRIYNWLFPALSQCHNLLQMTTIKTNMWISYYHYYPEHYEYIIFIIVIFYVCGFRLLFKWSMIVSYLRRRRWKLSWIILSNQIQ